MEQYGCSCSWCPQNTWSRNRRNNIAMRVFLCLYEGFSLAVPTKAVLSIFLFKENGENNFTGDTILCNKTFHENEKSAYIFLPHLFDCPGLKIHHGIIIKKEYRNDYRKEIIFLGTEIISENEIPSCDIYPLPGIFMHFKLPHFFSGIYFPPVNFNFKISSKLKKPDFILFLDPLKLITKTCREFLSW